MGVPAHSMASVQARALAHPELQPTILSTDPLVVQFDDFVGDAEAAAILAAGGALGYEPSEVLQKGLQGGAGGQMDWKRSLHRTSQSTFCPSAHGSPCFEALRPVLERAQAIVGLGAAHTELQMLQYDEGQYYKIHSDFLSGSEQLRQGPRALTLLIYLDEPQEGGETTFPELGVTVKAKRGRALLWPSGRDAEPLVKDLRTRHAALPVTRGGKHAVNVWYYQRDLREAHALGCSGG